MPGLSLWLLPPSSGSDSDIETHLQTFISTSAPKLLGQTLPTFGPHITLTSYIPPESIKPTPQAWLDSLLFPSEEALEVNFKQVSTGTAFFKKLYIRMQKTPSLVKLASTCRCSCVEEAESPWRNDGGNVDREHTSMPVSEGESLKERMQHWESVEYDPHLSLIYSDMTVSEEQRSAAEKELERLGITMHDSGVLAGSGTGGWKGGRVALVNTHLDLKDWDVVAERVL